MSPAFGISLFFAFSLGCVRCQNASTVWDGERVLDETKNGKYTLRWSVEGGNITFEIQVETQGWVGLGISPANTMKDADMMLGWVVTSNGTVVLGDRFSQAFSLPPLDDQQDLELLEGRKNATHTIIRFRRKLETGDTEQDYPIKAGATNVLFAWSETEPTNETSIKSHYGNYGKTQIDFLMEPGSAAFGSSQAPEMGGQHIIVLSSAALLFLLIHLAF